MCDERLIHWSSFYILGNVKHVGENIISKVCVGFFTKKKPTNLYFKIFCLLLFLQQHGKAPDYVIALTLIQTFSVSNALLKVLTSLSHLFNADTFQFPKDVPKLFMIDL